VNFVTSEEPKGTYLSPYNQSYDGVFNLSAGHKKHEYTTGAAFDEILQFFQDNDYLLNKLKEMQSKLMKENKGNNSNGDDKMEDV